MSSPSLLRYRDVVSDDGTRLRAWSNDGDGPDVVISNGLGANPHAWPTLLQPDSGVRAVGWNHRGIGGSDRPRSGRADMDAHLEDALAVMDDAGVGSAVVVGWSTGVTVAFELARRHPERVSGILAVAGVPNEGFGSMLSPLRLPSRLARSLVLGAVRLTAVGGRGIAPLSTRVPWTAQTTGLARSVGRISPGTDAATLQTVLQEFFATDPAWFARLALGLSRHPEIPLSGITVPTTFLAGSWDMFSGSIGMRAAAERLPGSRFRELRATHLLPVEHPEIVLDELHLLLDRLEAQPWALGAQG